MANGNAMGKLVKIAQRGGNLLLVFKGGKGFQTVYVPLAGAVRAGDGTIHSDHVLMEEA